MKNIKLKNYTGHPVYNRVTGTDYPIEGDSRCSNKASPVGLAEDSSVIVRYNYASIIGLPPPQEGVMFIVSAITLNGMLALGRVDGVVPYKVEKVVNRHGEKTESCAGFRING